MYFDSFPSTSYTINGKTEEVVDIFRKISLSGSGVNALTEILVQDADTLESLAKEYYGDEDLSWIILVTNNIIDPTNEFIRSSQNLQSLIDNKYSGDILYFEENIPLQEGDLLIKVTNATSNTIAPDALATANIDTATYCFVNSYSKEFRYARVTNINGTIAAGGKFAAYRNINGQLMLIAFDKEFSIGGGDQDSCVLILKKKDIYLNAPIHILTSTSEIVSPYQKYLSSTLENDFVSIRATGTFSDAVDDNAFEASVLYQFIMNNQNLGLISFTIGEDLRLNNEKFRTIKMIPKNLITSFIDTFNTLISNDNVRSRIITSKG